ncbi:unnamed protein product [Polarella glacialis]|uniref:VWFA domain-containing protein n=1 Tax=Polarella glacialis TaxID=89957 RepID=A0A813I2S3_POLGL|nr:unnamed protein product [Polarella glacialis]
MSDTAPDYYAGGCLAVACPPHSSGADVGSGCSCNSGFLGSIQATSSSPFYDGSCVATTTSTHTVTSTTATTTLTASTATRTSTTLTTTRSTVTNTRTGTTTVTSSTATTTTATTLTTTRSTVTNTRTGTTTVTSSTATTTATTLTTTRSTVTNTRTGTTTVTSSTTATLTISLTRSTITETVTSTSTITMTSSAATTTTTTVTTGTVFVTLTRSTCADEGFWPILDASACLSAATSLGFNISWGPHGGYPDIVDGCSVRWESQLFHNIAGDCDPLDDRAFARGCRCSLLNSCICRAQEGFSTSLSLSTTLPPNDTIPCFSEVLILVDYTLGDGARQKDCQSFAADLAGNLSFVLKRKVCVGVITFTENAIYQPTFLDAQNPANLRSAVFGSALPEENVASPDLHAALNLSERTFRFQDGGIKVVVLVSARESSSPEESVRMASKLKDEGVTIFVVSVDEENDMTSRRDKELKEMVSSDDYWFDITWPPNVSDVRRLTSPASQQQPQQQPQHRRLSHPLYNMLDLLVQDISAVIAYMIDPSPGPAPKYYSAPSPSPSPSSSTAAPSTPTSPSPSSSAAAPSTPTSPSAAVTSTFPASQALLGVGAVGEPPASSMGILPIAVSACIGIVALASGCIAIAVCVRKRRRVQASPNEIIVFSKVLPSAEPQAESAEQKALRAAMAEEDLAWLTLALAEVLNNDNNNNSDFELLLQGAEALVKVLERRQELEEALSQWLHGEELEELGEVQDLHELRKLLEEGKKAKASPDLIRQVEEQLLKLRASEIEGWLIRATENEDSHDLNEWLEEADKFDNDAKSFNVRVDKLVVEEARLKLASVSKLEEAEDTLLKASQAEDLEAIALALAGARAAGVSPDRIRQAEDLLVFLKKQFEAEEELRQAVAEEAVDEICRLMEVARAVGSKGAILEEARLMLESIRDSQEALSQAMRENNLRSLRKAVDKANEHRALLAKVREAEEQKAKLRAEAEAALEEAMHLNLSEDLPEWVTELQEALTDAESVEASPEKIAEAQALLDKLRSMLSAEKMLREAMEGRDLDLIAQRLAEAREAGVNEDLLASMEHKADVIARLLKAMKDGYADDIAEILASHAEEAGLDEALRRDAEEMMKSIRASEEELRRPVREQNMRNLRKIMRGVNMGKQLERMANEHKELLAQLKIKAEGALRTAMAGSDANELAECIDDAKSAGLVETLIKKAERKLSELRLAAAAESALRQALQERDVLLIAQRYREALLAGAKPELLDEARQVLDSIRLLNEAEAALRQAMASDDIAAIGQSLQAAQAAGVAAEILQEAAELLSAFEIGDLARIAASREKNHRLMRQCARNQRFFAVLDSHLEDTKESRAKRKAAAEDALREAMKRGADLDEVSECLDEAKAIGASPALIKKAEAFKDDLGKTKKADAALREAMELRDLSTVASAYRGALLTGVDPGLVEKAQQLMEELKKIADAEEALRKAMTNRELEPIQKRLDEAKELRSDPELLKKADDLVVELVRLGQAEEALTAAMKEKVLESLAERLDEAKSLGARPLLIKKGESLLADLRNIREKERALIKAMEDRDRNAVAQCRMAAMLAGGDAELLQQSQELLGELQELWKVETTTALTDAMESTDIDALAKLISEAKDANVEPDLAKKAEEWLSYLRRKAAAEDGIRQAMASQNADTISATVEKVRAAEPNPELVKEAEELAQSIRDAAEALAKAIHEKNFKLLRKGVIWAHGRKEMGDLYKRAQEAQAQMMREAFGKDMSIALDTNNYAQMRALHRRAKTLELEDLEVCKRAVAILSKLYEYTVEVQWTHESTAGPSGTEGWRQNPTVEVRVVGAPGSKSVPVFVTMEDMDGPSVVGGAGDPKYGFVLARNERNVPDSCPVLCPGGPTFEDSPYGEGDTASTTATANVEVLQGSRFFAIPSLLDQVKNGGKARFDFLSLSQLTCRLLPDFDKAWVHQETISEELSWNSAKGTAGGPLSGGEKWLKNPQIRIYLDEKDKSPLCVMGLFRLSPDASPDLLVALHAAKNKKSMSYNPHANVNPKGNHTIIAQTDEMFVAGRREVALCLEIKEQDLILEKGAATPPFYFLTSLANAGDEGTFEVELKGTGKFRVEIGGPKKKK